MKEYDEMIAWLLGNDDNEGSNWPSKGAHGDDKLLSCLQNTIDQDCSHHESFQLQSTSQFGSQAADGELAMFSPPLHGSSVLVPGAHRCGWAGQGSEVSSSCNPCLVGVDCLRKEIDERGEDDVKPSRGIYFQQNEATNEDAKAWRKYDRPMEKRRDPEKHSISERFDAASIIGDAIDYVKALQFHIQAMVTGSRPSSTTFSTTTKWCQCEQSPQHGSMGVRANQGICFDGNDIPRTTCSLDAPLIPSPGMAHFSLSCLPSTLIHNCAAPNFPRTVIQFPRAPINAPYEGFFPSCTFHSASASQGDQHLLVPTQVHLYRHSVK